jgi:protein associated with RNAse G/E
LLRSFRLILQLTDETFLLSSKFEAMHYSKEFVTINSRKFDGTIHRTWKANLIEQQKSLLTFVGEFEKEIKHQHLGLIRRGTISYEFYWLDGWFNVFRFHEIDGSLRNFYCNLNMPPKFENNILDYVDLDVDVLVWKDFSVEILDMDEFEENSKKFNYSAEIKKKTNESLNKILELIENRDFPFDIKI